MYTNYTRKNSSSTLRSCSYLSIPSSELTNISNISNQEYARANSSFSSITMTNITRTTDTNKTKVSDSSYSSLLDSDEADASYYIPLFIKKAGKKLCAIQNKFKQINKEKHGETYHESSSTYFCLSHHQLNHVNITNNVENDFFATETLCTEVRKHSKMLALCYWNKNAHLHCLTHSCHIYNNGAKQCTKKVLDKNNFLIHCTFKTNCPKQMKQHLLQHKLNNMLCNKEIKKFMRKQAKQDRFFGRHCDIND